MARKRRGLAHVARIRSALITTYADEKGREESYATIDYIDRKGNVVEVGGVPTGSVSNEYVMALLARAEREGVPIRKERRTAYHVMPSEWKGVFRGEDYCPKCRAPVVGGGCTECDWFWLDENWPADDVRPRVRSKIARRRGPGPGWWRQSKRHAAAARKGWRRRR